MFTKLFKYDFFRYNIPHDATAHSGVQHAVGDLPVAATVARTDRFAAYPAASAFIGELPVLAGSATGLNLNPVTISHFSLTF